MKYGTKLFPEINGKCLLVRNEEHMNRGQSDGGEDIYYMPH